MAKSRSITYEVYYQQNGRWQLQASFDAGKKDDAVDEAKRLEKEGHLQGACVVREAYDKATNLSHESVIYCSPGLKGKVHVGGISSADGHLKNAPEGSVAANAAIEARKREAAFQEQQKRDAERQEAEKANAARVDPKLARPPSAKDMEPGGELIKIALAFLAASIGGTAVTTLCFLLLHMTGVFLGRNVTLSILAAAFGLTFLLIFLPSLKKILAASRAHSRRALRPAGAVETPLARDADDQRADATATADHPANENSEIEDTSGSGDVPYSPDEEDSKPVPDADPIAPPQQPEPSAHDMQGGAPIGAVSMIGKASVAMPDKEHVASDTGISGKPSFPTAAEIRASAVPVHVMKKDDRPLGPEPMAEALGKVVAEARQYLGKRLSEDAYTRFGLILFLAGFSEPMMLYFRVAKNDALKVLVDSVMRLGVEQKQARGFCGNVDEYLLDERYFGMYSLGRSGGNRCVADEMGDSGVREAIKVWQSPTQPEPVPPPAEGSGAEENGSRFVAVLFTDIVNSTEQQQSKGDEWLMKVIRAHNDIVREALSHHQGREIKHTGDGIMASFTGIVPAVEAVLAMQQGFMRFSEAMPDLAFKVRAGLSAGEPIHESGDLFGTPVNLAARVMNQAEGGEIAVSAIVRELCRGKEFEFKQVGMFELKGFEEPQPIYHIIGAKKAEMPKQGDLP